MQKSNEEKLNANYMVSSEAEISQEFYTRLKLSKQDDNEASLDNHGEDEREEEEEEEEEEFSFVCGGANTSPIAAEDIFVDGQIRPVYPLFNRDLFFSGENLLDSLPTRPPVKKIFVETNEDGGQKAPSSPDRKAVEVLRDVCRKSNSTGFSKIWRFKDFLGRSNSDGRDAFVFLNSGHEAAAAKGEENKAPKGKAKKGKTASLSAHEVYLRSKAKDGERRRSSYLPYRPELMGFFTNVNGGLTKNIHPF
ncbi:hypothetical protein STAS_32454 [Striga asiatica]|uniref:Uncharacterized protein n=1 Tax=Striga asiatica TaxID=4170 RepID=A0A5A7RAQ6_STRAF|nr:hypothetical protein STAS_32454 [Striga asiatica]